MQDFIGYARFVVINSEQLLHYAMKEKDNTAEEAKRRCFSGFFKKISKENEAGAWRHISKVADEALAKYPTTLEEDQAILSAEAGAGGKLNENKQNCIMFRSK